MYCKDCRFRKISDYNHRRWFCDNKKISEDFGFSKEESEDMLIYPYIESALFFVGEKFGCIHFKPIDNS